MLTNTRVYIVYVFYDDEEGKISSKMLSTSALIILMEWRPGLRQTVARMELI